MITGTPEEVKKHCKDLIETAGKGGGYILSYGATPNQAKIGNIIAMRDSAKEFGVYRK
jgi:uroporphyrinogen-III decarboxylase